MMPFNHLILCRLLLLPSTLRSFQISWIRLSNWTELNLTYQKDFPSVAVVKNLPTNAGDTRDTDSIPGLRKYPEGGKGNHFIILSWEIP